MSSRIFVTTGPESSGKTTLAQDLSERLAAPLVLEASRDYLNTLYSRAPGLPYQQSDLLEIARLQVQRERAALAEQHAQVVCDTDLLVILVWSEVKYGSCETALLDLFADSLALAPRHYLLCDYRIPWEADPLREHPHARDMLYRRYLDTLERFGLAVTEVSGAPGQRLQQALAGAALLTP